MRLDELVGETVDAMRVQADARHVQVRAELPPRPAPGPRRPGEAPARAVQPDPERDPPHAGRRLGRRARARRAGDAVEIEVADTGDGIAADERDRVFEPFFRGGEQAARPTRRRRPRPGDLARDRRGARRAASGSRTRRAGTRVRFSIAVHKLTRGVPCAPMAHQQLWLLRHGEAVPHESKPDFDRELTARGERQSVAAGEALARLGVEFAACYTSPLVRARGTARAGVRAAQREPEERDAVGKGFDVDVVRELLAEHDDGRADPRRRPQPVVRAGRARPHRRARRLQEGRRRRGPRQRRPRRAARRCCARASSSRSRSARCRLAPRERGVDHRERDLGAARAATRRARTRPGCAPCRRAARGRRR